MQIRIIPKPKGKSDLLEILKIFGLVTHEDESRIVLQFDKNISLKEVAKKYPEFGFLIFGNLESKRSLKKQGFGIKTKFESDSIISLQPTAKKPLSILERRKSLKLKNDLR